MVDIMRNALYHFAEATSASLWKGIMNITRPVREHWNFSLILRARKHDDSE